MGSGSEIQFHVMRTRRKTDAHLAHFDVGSGLHVEHVSTVLRSARETRIGHRCTRVMDAAIKDAGRKTSTERIFTAPTFLDLNVGVLRVHVSDRCSVGIGQAHGCVRRRDVEGLRLSRRDGHSKVLGQGHTHAPGNAGVGAEEGPSASIGFKPDERARFRVHGHGRGALRIHVETRHRDVIDGCDVEHVAA